MTMEAKIRPWLLWTLIGVVLIGGGFTYWYISGGKSGTAPTTSPTATKSAVVSPSAGTTPTSGKTATPDSDQTATPASTATPTTTPPDGWKEVTNTAVGAGSANFQFSVYIKNDWTMYNNNDTAHGPVFYTSNTNCNGNTGYGPGTGYQNCWDHLAVAYYSLSDYAGASDLTIKTYSYPDGSGNAYVGVNKSLSASDQEIIFSSFKVLSHRTRL